MQYELNVYVDSYIALNNRKRNLKIILILLSELMAQRVRGSTSVLCRAKRHGFEPHLARELYQYHLPCPACLHSYCANYSSAKPLSHGDGQNKKGLYV